MEQATEQQINLFNDNLPSIDEIKTLAEAVNSSERSQIEFAEQINENMNKTSDSATLATGIGLFIIGKNAKAIEKLEKAKACKEKFIYAAMANRKLKNFDEAIKNLKESTKHKAAPLVVAMNKAAVYRCAGDFEQAEKEIKSCANFENVSAEYHYQLARIQEAQGLYNKATDNYKTAMELSPEHNRAIFHLAYRCDLSGNEEAAMDYYRQVVSTNPVYISALLNLTVLYEDAGKFEKALQCVEKVLMYHPNHKRANLYKKDIVSSKTMFYDEEKEKKKNRRVQILETPISDFELSVRSRNCLKKMNINSLSDLLNITEAELLSYKNFGETSLKEIKIILDAKALRLGMALEEKQNSPEEISADSTDEDNVMLNKTVDELQLSVRSRNCLQRLNLRKLGDLTRRAEAELLGCKNFGVTSLNEIKKALEGIGLSLRKLD